MLQHASMALVETECNAVQGYPVSCNSQRACVPTGRSAGRVWPNSKPQYVPSALLSSCRDCRIRRAQFPTSPLITNVGGCGGQSSVHAPPRTPESDWPPRACVNLKPVESNLSLSFETAAPTTTPRDREPPNAVTHCIVTHTHTQHQQYTGLAISSCELRPSDPLMHRQDRVSDAYGDAASRLKQ
jgi:hypothetical protein